MILDKKEIAKANLAIALYMGWQKYPTQHDHYMPGQSWGVEDRRQYKFRQAAYRPEEMLFHESMDWLWSVIQKIRLLHKVEMEFVADSVHVRILVTDDEFSAFSYLLSPGTGDEIEAVFSTIYEYVQWAKKQTKKMAS